MTTSIKKCVGLDLYSYSVYLPAETASLSKKIDEGYKKKLDELFLKNPHDVFSNSEFFALKAASKAFEKFKLEVKPYCLNNKTKIPLHQVADFEFVTDLFIQQKYAYFLTIFRTYIKDKMEEHHATKPAKSVKKT